MYLKKLYIEQSDLFEPVVFKDGINFIYGKKDNIDDSKDSLNGIGKSLFLDLIDFCLLSNISERIKLAIDKGILSNEKVSLDFEVAGNVYTITRSVETPNKNIQFKKNGSEGVLYSDKELKPIICDLVFLNPNYKGKYSNKWLRKLLPFFIKIQTSRKFQFADPVKYIKECSEAELNIYHLFFIGIDNLIAYKNFEIQSNIKQKKPAIKEIKELVEDTYNLKDINEATNEIDNISSEVKKIEDAISTFHIADQYHDVEVDANKLTVQIKDLWFENFSDKKKLVAYKDSFNVDSEIDSTKISNLYKEISDVLSVKIKESLDKAIEFRKNIANSRKDFLGDEIKKLEQNIFTREDEIKVLEKERIKYFNFLSSKDAIKDLSEAYVVLSEKKDKLKILEGKTMIYTTLNKEMAELRSEEAKIYSETVDFIESIKNDLKNFRDVFRFVYNSIYLHNQNQSVFSLSTNERSDSKIEINVAFPADLSKGRNQGKTLIYDLSVLFYGIENNINIPKFLIHDGIFDGMDKAHFISLYELLENKSRTNRFQYLITLNEEGTLSSKFGKAEKVTPEKIESEAILILTPRTKLFKKSF